MADAICDKCEDPFTDPRILPCLHTFCLKCLLKISENTNEPLQCPTCDEKVPLPSGGAQEFPRDRCKAHDAEKARLNGKIESGDEKCDQCVRADSGNAVAFCVQCSDFLCEACRDHHRTWRKTLDHEIIPTGERLSKGDEGSVFDKYRPQPALCATHSEKLKYYCKQCKELICRDCTGSKVHKSHSEQCVLIDEVADEEMTSLKSNLSRNQNAISELSGAISRCKKTTEQVKAKKDAIDQRITSSLNQVRDTLLKQNADIYDHKVGVLEAQERELVHIKKGLDLASHLITESSRYTADQQLSTKDVIATRVDQLLKQFQTSDLNPLENDTFLTRLSQPSTVSQMTSLYHVSGGAHAASSTFESGIPSRIYPGREYTMNIKAWDRQGKAVGSGGERVKAEIRKSERTQVPNLYFSPYTDHITQSPRHANSGVVRATCQAVDNGDGTYTIHYTPQSPGQHELHATIAGRPIKGSPLQFTVKQPRNYASLSCQTGINNSYNNPWDVAFAADGSIVVAHYGSHMVIAYNTTTSKQVFSFGNGAAGSASNQFYSPSGVAVSGDTIYVAESGYNRIKTFSISRKCYVTTFKDNPFSSPRGICVDLEGKVFVADYGKHCVRVFKGDGVLQYSITGDTAVKESQFQHPWGLAFDPHGNLHIAAHDSHSIKVCSPAGAYISCYGDGTVNSPAGIAINREGVIAVSEDGGKNRLWIYDRNQKTLLKTIEGAFSNGRGIACDDNDIFWVAGYSNNRIYKC
jgi:sugar lactone lactonase YvrE